MQEAVLCISHAKISTSEYRETQRSLRYFIMSNSRLLCDLIRAESGSFYANKADIVETKATHRVHLRYILFANYFLDISTLPALGMLTILLILSLCFSALCRETKRTVLTNDHCSNIPKDITLL